MMKERKPAPGLPVLIVDDDPTFLQFMTAALSREGYAYEVAVTGDQALAMLRKTKVHAVLLDLKLPDRDGVEVLRDIVKDTDHPPVIFVSGAASITSALEAGRLGAAGYLEKPFRLRELLAILDPFPDSSRHSPLTSMANVDHERTRIELASASAVRRLAEVVLGASQAAQDFKNGRGLAATANTGYGTMRHWCRIAQVPGREFVKFARGFWATRKAQRTGLSPIEALDSLEIETGGRILEPALPPGTTVEEFCACQTHLPPSHTLVVTCLNLLSVLDSPTGRPGRSNR